MTTKSSKIVGDSPSRSRASAEIVVLNDYLGWGDEPSAQDSDLLEIDDLVAQQEQSPEGARYIEQARSELARQIREGAKSSSLKSLRLSKGFSQAELARVVGTRQPHIAKIEGGASGIHFSTAVKIARALEISADELADLLGLD